MTLSICTVITSAEEGGYVFSSVCMSVCLFVCLSVELLANLWTDFDEIFCRGRAWLKDQVIQFWWRSGSHFGFGSPKSEIRILRIGRGLCSLSTSSYFMYLFLLSDYAVLTAEHNYYYLQNNNYYYTTIVLRLSGFYLGQPGWASTRRNIHPLTPIMVINHPVSASSIYYDPWHPLCSIHMPDSLFPQSLHNTLLVWHPPLHTPYMDDRGSKGSKENKKLGKCIAGNREGVPLCATFIHYYKI